MRPAKSVNFISVLVYSGTGVALDAFEIRKGHPGGYQFQVDRRPWKRICSVLLGKLIEKIRRALSRTHLKKEKYGVQIADRTVCGTIAWDEAEDGSHHSSISTATR